ncbi:hypothetical protein [Nocardia sp. NPDC046763]|uniref:hypothetical protein n=1 Tax=Nocardia sp. NPDC046763 TaxID=3155256 RepID=UPI0033E6AADC
MQAPGGIGYLGQSLELLPTATVGAAIDLALSDIRALEARMCTAEAELAVSGPLGRRLELAATLASAPKLLLLDELTNAGCGSASPVAVWGFRIRAA